MNCDSTPKSSFSVSLSNLFRLGFFETIHAKSHSNPESGPSSPRNERSCPVPPPCDRRAGGDAPHSKKAASKLASANKSTTSNRGKTGAGVTGSRTGPVCEAKDPTGLPSGALKPGLLRYIHNAARYRLPQCFEGACLSVKQNSSTNWVLGHTLSFSSVSPGGYKLLLSYSDKSTVSSLPYFVMEAAPGGQMSCEARVAPSESTRATVVAQIADAEFYSFESIFDAYFGSSTASIIAVNREFIALHFLQVGT